LLFIIFPSFRRIMTESTPVSNIDLYGSITAH
jgi:hypothetical protein